MTKPDESTGQAREQTKPVARKYPPDAKALRQWRLAAADRSTAMAATLKDEIRQLVDELPETELPYVRRFLEYVRAASAVAVPQPDPLLSVLANAPIDDEAETEEERAAVEVAREQATRGEVIPDAELWERLGHAPARRVDARRRS